MHNRKNSKNNSKRKAAPSINNKENQLQRIHKTRPDTGIICNPGKHRKHRL